MRILIAGNAQEPAPRAQGDYRIDLSARDGQSPTQDADVLALFQRIGERLALEAKGWTIEGEAQPLADRIIGVEFKELSFTLILKSK